MKLCCELPLQMMDENDNLNDYDFILFHLLENESYKNHFLNSSRFKILDNSAYEFFVRGKKLDLEKFNNAIVEQNPNYFILPDVLMDVDETLKKTEVFLDDFWSGTSEPIGVLQGNSLDDFFWCLDFYESRNIEAIGIPFHNTFFSEQNPPEAQLQHLVNIYGKITKDHLYALGRYNIMVQLRPYLRKFKHVHLLGSHCPFEFGFYRGEMWSSLKTMDTGYPTKCGIQGIKIGTENSKPTIIIDDFLYINIDKTQREMISENIKITKHDHN